MALNIGGKWKRFMSVGCSHGMLADPKAIAAALKFRDEYQPETRVHHGDWADWTAFRSGAKGTPDERASIALDMAAGVGFVEDYRATHLLNGNHDIRVYRMRDSNNALEANCASRIINDMQEMCRKLDCKFMESYDIRKSWFEFGDTKFLHGFFYNVSAIRDHAERFGNCVHTHIHQVGQMSGRRAGEKVTGYSAGYLADEDQLTYGHTRAQTLAHQQGFAYGHYSDTECKVYLATIENGIASVPLGVAA